MMKLNKNAYLILGMLNMQKLSGYDIKGIMIKVANFYWSESNAQIYPILKKLEDAGFVSSEIDESSGNRKRRVFSITKEGKAILLDWLREPTEITPYREEILLKITNLSQLNKKDRLKTIQSYYDSVVKKLEDLKGIASHIHDEHDDDEFKSCLMLKHDHAKMILEAKLKWADKAKAMLEK